MHLTLKTEATSPAAANVLQQQARFDTFVDRFNHVRPHQALDMKTPGTLYTASPRLYQGLEEREYPSHDWTAVITTCGRICYQRRKVNVSQVFAGQKVGVKQVNDHIWLVTFMHYDLGYFDDETCRLEPIDNPFGSKLLGGAVHHLRSVESRPSRDRRRDVDCADRRGRCDLAARTSSPIDAEDMSLGFGTRRGPSEHHHGPCP